MRDQPDFSKDTFETPSYQQISDQAWTRFQSSPATTHAATALERLGFPSITIPKEEHKEYVGITTLPDLPRAMVMRGPVGFEVWSLDPKLKRESWYGEAHEQAAKKAIKDGKDFQFTRTMLGREGRNEPFEYTYNATTRKLSVSPVQNRKGDSVSITLDRDGRPKEVRLLGCTPGVLTPFLRSIGATPPKERHPFLEEPKNVQPWEILL